MFKSARDFVLLIALLFAGTQSSNSQINLWRSTENLSSNFLYGSTSLTKTGRIITVHGIKLSQITGSSFYTRLYTNLSSIGFTGFQAGHKYLLSYYILNANNREQFVWFAGPQSSGDNGQGTHFVDGSLRRISQTFTATSNNAIDPARAPTTPDGQGAGQSIMNWLSACVPPFYTPENDVNFYVGGFQIEEIPITEVQGIGTVGDSTIQFCASNMDYVNCKNWVRYAEGLMNITWFDRAVGGHRTDQILSDYTTNMRPIAQAGRVRYVYFNGGINDISQGVPLATLEHNLQAIYDAITADAIIPVIETVTPSVSIASSDAKEQERQAVNVWIRSSFPLVVDADAIIRDPNDPSSIRHDSQWSGDGTHFGTGAQKALASYIANSTVGNSKGYPNIWSFRKPSVYVPVP